MKQCPGSPASAAPPLTPLHPDHLQHLSGLLEVRSPDMTRHAERVTHLAVHLGRQFGLSGEHLTHLHWGAYLHDIGKSGIADHVLNKPAPLDPHERRQMHQHVTIGEKMLRQQSLVPEIPEHVLEIVRHHHERWDGQGYPDRLRGTEIPLLARIFAVVDVYDALTSKRSYKPSWSPRDTLNELRRMAGTHLDPHLVACFEKLLEQHPHLMRPHSLVESAD